MIIFILGIALFSKTYHLERMYQLGWDQDRDANVVWEILKNKNLTLIGPRAVGPDGFFLGPIWYYLLVPFYFLFGMDPIAAPLFGLFVGLATTIAVYVFAKKWFDTNTAVISSLFWATLADRMVWNPILIPIFTLVIIFLLRGVLSRQKRYLIWLFIVFGLSLQIHFQAVFFVVPIFFGLCILLYRRILPIKELLLGVLSFFLTFLPLILFDIRHDYINTNSFLGFFSGTSGGLNLAHSFSTYLKYIISVFPVPFEAHEEFYLLLFAVSIIGILIGKIGSVFKTILLSILLLPPIAFSFYGGNLSEYYYSLCMIPMTLGLAIVLAKIFNLSFIGKFFAMLCLFLLLIQRTDALFDTFEQRSLFYKRQAVKMIVEQKMDPVFNVSYSAPFNEDTGFRYLFKYYGRLPENTPAGHLWTIVIPAGSEDVEPLATFGDIGVIRR